MKLLLPDAVGTMRPDALSPLEERLSGANAAQAREQTQVQLQGLEQRARAGMAAGVAPDRYRELAALLDACLAAQEVLEHCALPLSATEMRDSSRMTPPPELGSRFSRQGA
ncbi:EscE/YscE/SsaE family type III secretion system needle protein co-chaperone [Pantoea sp. 18069]|uniref:EscE/YscE/SsaE family type III secretion system needle protein co-chaperone n=1 Tax=Pantoea sp. 18069 TaxID=2681415 RepID=UPI00135BA52F|nr:EscE/YscE/SsaE family type III secretion system needle protein co-chaperone [Pantoea sp. 18069]